mgnify:CR=1 FL=1
MPCMHPSRSTYSRLKDHYNILDIAGFAGLGTTGYQPQINLDGRCFPHFSNLSEMWDKGADYTALFPNVLIGVHNDHYFNIILSPDGTGRTNEQIEIYYADEAAPGENYAALRAINTKMWKTVFSENVQVVEDIQLGRSAPGFDGGKFSAVMDESTHHFHKWVAKNLE